MKCLRVAGAASVEKTEFAVVQLIVDMACKELGVKHVENVLRNKGVLYAITEEVEDARTGLSDKEA